MKLFVANFAIIVRKKKKYFGGFQNYFLKVERALRKPKFLFLQTRHHIHATTYEWVSFKKKFHNL